MSAKQDRQGVRTAAALEQKWKFGDSFAEVYGIATDAQRAAHDAGSKADNPAANLTPDEVFNLLTNNGKEQGIYRDENGNICINATYLKSGIIKGLLISSENGNVQIDLTGNGGVVFNTGISTNGLTVRADKENAKKLLTVDVEPVGPGYDSACMRFHDPDGNVLLEFREDETYTGGYMTARDDTGKMETELESTSSMTGLNFRFIGELQGYLRMDSTGAVSLYCDNISCKEIEGKKVAWELREDGVTYNLIGYDPDWG